MNICVVGSGYVGLVSGTCLAELGHQVICIDNDEAKIAALKRGEVPIYEPGLKELIKKNVASGRLRFSGSIEEGVAESLAVFICVGTPSREDGEANLFFIEQVSKEIALTMDGYRLIIEKSTVPVETGEWIKRTVNLNNRGRHEYDVASNPEFLREGSAIEDFLYPDRIVVGVESQRAADHMREIYQPLMEGERETQFIVTDIKSAELIKHASNSFLALKISYINVMADICEAVGADVEEVALGMGLDSRIGAAFLNAGVGFGGSCFPKDVKAFRRIAENLGCNYSLLDDVLEINHDARRRFMKKIVRALWNPEGKTIGILGVSFKPGTDDIREAPSIYIMRDLIVRGARIKAYDPEAKPEAAFEAVSALVRQRIIETTGSEPAGPPPLEFCRDPYEVAEGAELLALLTEWDEFKKLDLERVRDLLAYPIVADGRNVFSPKEMERLGFEYFRVGS